MTPECCEAASILFSGWRLANLVTSSDTSFPASGYHFQTYPIFERYEILALSGLAISTSAVQADTIEAAAQTVVDLSAQCVSVVYGVWSIWYLGSGSFASSDVSASDRHAKYLSFVAAT